MPPYSTIIIPHQLCENVGSVRKRRRHVQKRYFQNSAVKSAREGPHIINFSEWLATGLK